jgi:uncharacterized membrane protein
MDDVILARALHVLAVIHWIGGLSFVTLVILPLSRAHRAASEAPTLFDSVERRFAAQVRVSVPVVGITGLWMTYRMRLWDRFVDPHFWWMGAMLRLWLVFMLVLFVIEPVLHSRFAPQARRGPEANIRLLHRAHLFLLLIAAITALGAVAGANGFAVF